ncbi:MAG: hypothetical protein JWL79_3697 [Frankiales bacterium]|nr:hypothetical protein [Frankiales bacterium]
MRVNRLVLGGVLLAAVAVGGCSGVHSRPLSSSEQQRALVDLREGLSIPSGFTQSTDACPDQYICFASATAAALTSAEYGRLLKTFRVTLSEGHCDQMLPGRSGNAVQQCDGYGSFDGYGLASILTMTRSAKLGDATTVSFAPARVQS